MKYEIGLKRLQSCLLEIKSDFGDFEIEHKFKEGRNNSVYKIANRKKQKFILKIYQKNDLLNYKKFNKEISFLKYLEEIGSKNVPRLVYKSEKSLYIIMTFLEGEKIIRPTRQLNNDFLKFIQEINVSTYRKNSKMLELAADACLKPEELIKVIDNRIAALNFPIGFDLKDLSTFFFRDVINSWKFLKKNINLSDIDLIIDRSQLIVSPSDVGFHNCLKQNTKVLFFDFEHSGLDDIAKLAIDFILQPDSINYPKYLEDILDDFSKIDGLNISWIKRFQEYLDIYRIKWILIMLQRLKNNYKKNSEEELNSYFSKITYYYEKSNLVVQNSKKICFDFYKSKIEDA